MSQSGSPSTCIFTRDSGQRKTWGNCLLCPLAAFTGYWRRTTLSADVTVTLRLPPDVVNCGSLVGCASMEQPARSSCPLAQLKVVLFLYIFLYDTLGAHSQEGAREQATRKSNKQKKLSEWIAQEIYWTDMGRWLVVITATVTKDVSNGSSGAAHFRKKTTGGATNQRYPLKAREARNNEERMMVFGSIEICTEFCFYCRDSVLFFYLIR